MGESYLLGIDAGTSVVKVGIFDLQGREVAISSRRTTLLMPRPGWTETSMEETWQATVATIRDVLAAAQLDGSAIAAVGVSGNMVGAWLIDQHGAPVRNAILWSDGRTQPLIERLSAEHPGFMSTIFSYTGCVMQQGCTLPLVRWLAEHEPEIVARAASVLCCKDWLRFKLTGDIHLDPTEAAVLPGDTRTQSYSDDLFELLGISHLRHLFPPVVPSEQVAGQVTPQAGALTGLRPGTPVIAGAGDVPAVAIGIGAVEPGVACTILGTTCLSCLVVDRPIFEPEDVGLLFYIPGQRWLRALANVAGTTNIDWFIEQFCAAERASASSPKELFALLETLAQRSGIGARGVIYHPYLSAAGIIAPVVEPAARAQFFGLSQEHDRGDLLRAIYEGIAFAIRDCYRVLELPITEIRLSGGGARSSLWSQMIADCTGKQVVIPAGNEFGAKGAALLAGVAVGWFASVAQAATSTVQLVHSYQPDPARAARYAELYELYRDIRERLQASWRLRSELPGAI